MSFSSAFQPGAFQINAFQIVSKLADTVSIKLPINCVLAGQQDYEVGPTEVEQHDPNIKTRVSTSHGGGGRLSDNASSFSVKTGSKGYD